MLVEMKAELMTQGGEVGPCLSGAVHGDESLAFPPLMVGKAVVEPAGGLVEEVAEEGGVDGLPSLAECGFGDDGIGLPVKKVA